MLDNTYDLTIGASTVTMTRVKEQDYSSIYYGEDGDDKVMMTIAHTIPASGGSGESHMVRLDIEHYDSEGVYLRKSSAWTVIKTFDGAQSTSDAKNTQQALDGFLTSAIADKVLARES
jgi:hypothetical protein